ncbi:AIPR family protein [Microbacterium sp. LB12]|uniref:AIPR family protein n=1 Tax=Microbacterium sp. LB12 TaxID=3081270 RepID=UPI0030184F11
MTEEDLGDGTHAETLAVEIAAHQIGSRTPQAALLAWFLEAVWKLDPEEVIDAICDGPGDKGIDALYVDEEASEITVFQSKMRKNPSTSTQGDSELKAFVGVATYFESVEGMDSLIASKPNAELRKLLTRQKIRDRLADDSYSVRLVFLTNAPLDAAGADYVHAREGVEPTLVVYDGPMLGEVAERTRRPDLRQETVTIKALDPPIVRKLTETEQMAVTLVQAKELIALPGISDQTLFSRNVRLAVGRTGVNSQLKETVRKPSEHRLFPAFHNGLTLLTDKLTVEGTELTLTGVGVVNGCQSLTTLYNNSDAITDGLALLVKVVQVPSSTDVSDRITYRSNNQNAVTLRDQRSNDKATRALQRDVEANLVGLLTLQVKTGEQAVAGTPSIENTIAAQLIMAFYLGEPWAAVRKLRLFDQDFRRIFSRDIKAHHLYLVHLVDEAVSAARSGLRSDLAASFAAVRFTLVYLVSCVLDQSEAGLQLKAEPERWLADATVRAETVSSLNAIAEEVVDSVNDFIETRLAEDEDFDPKVTFKSQAGVAGVKTSALRTAKTLNRRGIGFYFSISPVSE